MADIDYTTLPHTRAEAQKLGSKIYYTGKPCKHGHVSTRRVSGGCEECRRIEFTQWRGKDPEKLRAKWRAWRATDRGKEVATAAVDRWRRADPKRAWASAAVTCAKIRAAKRGLPFGLTYHDIMPLCVDVCPALGIPLNYKRKGRKGPMTTSPTLDRIDGDKGYVLGNVAVISHRANSIKTNANATEIAKVASWLADIEKDKAA